MRRSPSLLVAPADQVVRRLLREHLAAAEQASRRLGANDPEALHDFRVALRRTRTLLRAYRETHVVPGKWRRHLRDLALATNAARDAEVALHHLHLRGYESHDSVPDGLMDRLTREEANARSAVEAHIIETWPPMATRLRESLAQTRKTYPESFGILTARLAQEEWMELQRLRDSLTREWNDDPAHRLRLAGKRLRYLLEPLAAALPPAMEAVAALKSLQDRFGDYHDLWVLLGLVAETAAAEAAACTHGRMLGADGYFDMEPWLDFARRLREERHGIAEGLRASYLAPDAPALQPVATAVAALSELALRPTD